MLTKFLCFCLTKDPPSYPRVINKWGGEIRGKGKNSILKYLNECQNAWLGLFSPADAHSAPNYIARKGEQTSINLSSQLPFPPAICPFSVRVKNGTKISRASDSSWKKFIISSTWVFSDFSGLKERCVCACEHMHMYMCVWFATVVHMV